MGLFATSSPFDMDVEKATSETNTSEQWDVIIDICDKVGSNSKNAKDCIRAIMRRMGHADPHVAIQAITLLDACIKNCGQKFHLEIASREFENEFKRLLSKAPIPIAQKMRVSLKKWAEGEFKTDAQLGLIPMLYRKLKEEGYDFSDSSQPPKVQPVLSKDPNVVSSQQEEDDIAKAIELSLKEKGEGAKAPASSYSSLYPAMSMNSNSSSSGSGATSKSQARKVRALYDFEAAEENELTFLTGEIIHVLDDSDPNWWKGYNDRGEGLFPSNFVTADLNAEPESTRHDTKSSKNVKFEDEPLREEPKPETVEIDEGKIDRLLYLLHEANPEDPSQDTEEMFILEAQVNQMLPLIDTELERVDRHHAKLTQLSSNLVDAINMYHTLMRDADMQLVGNYHGLPGHGLPPHMYNQAGAPTSNGMYNPVQPNMYSLPANFAMSQQQQQQHQIGNQFPSPQQMASAFHHHQHQQQQQQQQSPIAQHPSQIPQSHYVPGPIDPSKYAANANDIGSPGPHSLPPMNQAPHMQHIQQIQHPQSPQQINQFPTPQLQNHASQPSAGGEHLPPHMGIQSIRPNQNVPMNGQNQLLVQQQQQQLQMMHRAQQNLRDGAATSTQVPAAPQAFAAASGGMPQATFQNGLPPQNQPQPNQMQNPNMPMHGPGAVAYLPNTVMTAQIQQQQGTSQPSIAHMPPNSLAHLNINVSPNHALLQQQQQQHMAAINQPVTSTILPQSDQRTNIPIYQQQR